MSYFLNAFKSHFFKENFLTIQNLRENCGGFGYLQYSGIPFIHENAFLNASSESNQQDNLANLGLILLKKFGNPENVIKIFLKLIY